MQNERSYGITLIASSIILVVSMIVHPVGGSIAHIIKASGATIISHSIGIASIPFWGMGYYGLTRRLGIQNFLSLAAFFIVVTGLVAGMIAAAINGLALPIFVQRYTDASPETIEIIKPILRYGFALNKAFDFIFIGALCLSTLCWSIAIIRTRRIHISLGYLGVALCIIAIVMLFSGYKIISLHGFRLFIFGNVLWTILIGFSLRRAGKICEE